MLERIQETASYLKSKMKTQPETAIILGTGLGSLVNEITDKYEISYESIPNFPVSTVEGHSGKLIFGKLGNKEILAMQGRFHFYEGYAMTEVTFPVRVMRELGIKTLFVSNAAGGMNPDFEIGDLMIITDHINFFPEHPLRGKNIPYGPRFPDMSEAYSKELIRKANEIATEKGIKVQHGIYIGTQGPTYETPAEYKMFRILGADAVGMSTVPEVIVANHCGIQVFGISVITDLGVEGKIVQVTHEEVQKAADAAQPLMTTIMRELINRAEYMEEKNRTEISTIGEFGLIKRLTESIQIQNPETQYGVGDDAAVLEFGNKQTLVTTDLLMEGVHFDLVYTPMKHLGYKSAIVNFSDIYAMNGTPKQITVSLAVSKRFCIEDLEQFYEGLQLACQVHGVDIVGGDTTSSVTGLAISITCIGVADKDQIVYRNGAKETDLICVSGDLGAAYMGLQLLEREKAVFEGQEEANPDFAGKEYLLERQLKPEARKDIIEALAKENIRPTAMMDISDGLSSELMHICTQSHTGCRIYEERIPIDYQTAVMAEELNMNVTTCALNGGEDYELLFTVPLTEHDKVASMKGVKVIGHITKSELGCGLITRDGQEFELKAQGWNPLKK